MLPAVLIVGLVLVTAIIIIILLERVKIEPMETKRVSIGNLFKGLKKKPLKKEKKNRVTAAEIYDETDGTLDLPALQVVEKVVAMPPTQRTAEDYFTLGRVYEQNVAEGEVEGETMDRAAEAYQNAMQLVLLDDARLMQEFMVDHIAQFGFVEEIPALTDATRQSKDQHRKAVIAEVATVAKNRSEFADAFVAASTTHTSDPQNVHDPGVRVDNAHTLDKISGSSTRSQDAIEDARRWIAANNELTAASKMAAEATLVEIEKDGIISAYAKTETAIFRDVWERSYNSGNAANAENIRTAIVLGLAQAKGVCATGRIANVIGSLATLDFEDIGIAATNEQRRNEILHSAGDILDRELAAYKAAGDKGNVAAAFEDPNVEAEAKAMNAFKESVGKQIEKLVQGVAEYFSPDLLEQLAIDARFASGLDV